MMLPRGGTGTCPSNLSPSSLTGTTKSQLKCWCESEEAPSFWEQPGALGPRSELQNLSHRDQGVRVQPGPPSSRSGWAHLTQQWRLKMRRLTDNISEHFTTGYGVYWVSTLWSCKPYIHPGRQVHTQIYLVLRLKLNWCGCICSFYISFLELISILFAAKITICLIWRRYLLAVCTLLTPQKCKSQFRNTFGSKGCQIRS